MNGIHFKDKDGIHLQCRLQMDLINLAVTYGVPIFVKDRTKSKSPAVKRPIRFTEYNGSFLEGVLLPEKFHKLRVFTVFRVVYFDKADQAI